MCALQDWATSSGVQLAEFALYDTNGLYLAGGTTSNPEGASTSRDGHANAYNSPLEGGAAKWMDFNFGDLIITFAEPVTMQTYDWMAADDAPQRDPVKWTLEGSNSDGMVWAVVDGTYSLDAFVPAEVSSWLAAAIWIIP